jgi:hypothetical protein
MKLCKDCKHYTVGHSYQDLCKAKFRVDLVTGRKDYALAERMRDAILDGNCGAEGKLFEAKPVKLSLWQRFKNYLGTTFIP